MSTTKISNALNSLVYAVSGCFKNRLFVVISFTQIASVASIFGLGVLTSDEYFSVYVYVMAFSGFVSGMASSNNTSVIYVLISENENEKYLLGSAWKLFVYEQKTATLICLIFAAYMLLMKQVGILDLVALVLCTIFMSNTSLIAVCKMRASVFIHLQFVTLLNVSARFVLSWIGYVFLGEEYLVYLLLTIALVQYLYIVNMVVKLRSCNEGSDISEKKVSEIRQRISLADQYAIGIPISIIRSLSQSGVLLLSTYLLTPTETKLFRFLYLPRQYIGRFFGVYLPVVFDSIYKTKGSLKIFVVAAATGGVVFALYYAILGFIMFGELPLFSLAFTLFGCAVGLTYSLSSYQWSDVYVGKQKLNLFALVPGFFVLFGYLLYLYISGVEVTSGSLVMGLAMYYGLYCATRFLIQAKRKDGVE